MQVQVDIKIPSQREYKKMHWGLRETKKFEMVEATKQALILRDQLKKTSKLLLEVGGTIMPEHCYISPIVGVLRSTGWLEEGYTVEVMVSKNVKGITIHL